MQETIVSREQERSRDSVESALQGISQNIIVFIFGLLPLFFIPVAYVSFDYAKTVLIVAGTFLAIIFFSLSVLRSGRIRLSAPLALWGLWGVAIVSAISALLSGDMRDAFLGGTIGVHTALFVVLLALVATVPLLIGQSKTSIMRLYVLLTGSALVLGAFHLLRLVFGVDFLSFGLFPSQVSTPMGGWNDLALFFGLCVLLSLVAFEQLPLTSWGKGLFTTVVGLSLVVLAIVNFFAVWIVLGLVSLVVLMYSLTRDRFSEREKTLTLDGSKNTTSLQSILLSAFVFITSLVFVIGGSAVGGYISNLTGISYIEVRPSFEATMEITRSVFGENAFLGIGPNKFVDAWRMHKDPSINQTIFWATDFNGGSGYLTTFFVTTGILGMLAWFVFFALFLFAGFRMLFRTSQVDRFWYFIGSSSFVAAAYLWGMSAIYVPGAATLLLAAVFTSVVFAAYSALVITRPLSFSVLSNKRAGFVLVGVVMVVIVSSASALYYIGRHYASVHMFGEALYSAQTGGDLAQIEQQIASAYGISRNESYAQQLASYQLAKINALASVPELNTQQQQQLQQSIQAGIEAGTAAVQEDPTDALHWSTLGSIYSVLAGAAVEGAEDRARDAFSRARSLDPLNPLYALLEAQLNSRIGDLEAARASVQEAIELKSNYTDALLFLTQLDIAEGKTDAAVATTQAIISLEPNNPARYYQLGVLESSRGNRDEAIAAFQRAVELDNNYANARYLLALEFAQQGDTPAAIEQLQAVLELNPGNEDVTALIEQLRSGESLNLSTSNEAGDVEEPETVSADDDAVTTTEAPDTPLVSPVNVVGENGAGAETQTQSAQ